MNEFEQQKATAAAQTVAVSAAEWTCLSRDDMNTVRTAARSQLTEREAVFMITNTVLLGSPCPSRYFYAMKESNGLRGFFAEVADMIGVEQDRTFHPEGDVFVHTMLVLDCAARLRERAKEPLSFMYAALLHDAGKCEVTQLQENGRITAYGHEVLGDERVLRQMRRLTDENQLIQLVRNHAQLHMRPNMLYGAGSKKKKTRAMFDLSLCPEDLILLSRADASGKLDAPYDEGAEMWLRERLADYNARASVPMVTKRDLEAAGVTDEEEIAVLLRRARQLHFSGLNRGRAFKQIMQEKIQNDFKNDD